MAVGPLSRSAAHLREHSDAAAGGADQRPDGDLDVRRQVWPGANDAGKITIDADLAGRLAGN
jgi:hypothetical protein